MDRPPRKRFVLTLEAPADGALEYVALRKLLKRLLRAYGLRCVSVEEDVVSPDLRGKCVVCDKAIDESSFDRQEVVAVIGAEGSVFCCASHLTEDGPDGPKYQAALRAVAVAKATQLSMKM